MAGTRLQAARHIAGQICHFGRRRMSLLVFQDRQVAILQEFTTRRHQVLNAFAEIIPKGATPLALGIRQALAYIKDQQARHPLLVLITDGIPSKRYDENIQPLAEALAAAGEVRKADCNFLCIGLDSEDGFLQKLTASAGGVLHLF
jgi:magnesium chelatase subunit D